MISVPARLRRAPTTYAHYAILWKYQIEVRKEQVMQMVGWFKKRSNSVAVSPDKGKEPQEIVMLSPKCSFTEQDICDTTADFEEGRLP